MWPESIRTVSGRIEYVCVYAARTQHRGAKSSLAALLAQGQHTLFAQAVDDEGLGSFWQTLSFTVALPSDGSAVYESVPELLPQRAWASLAMLWSFGIPRDSRSPSGWKNKGDALGS